MQGSVAETISLEDGLRSGTGRLRPRARLLNSIGSELISSEIVAVIELLRNSYDADARRVEVIFSELRRGANALLEIRDDGHGMTRDILLGPWMEPGTEHKSAAGGGGTGGQNSPEGRRRLGSKGVGRFASQRLGRRLTVITRAPTSELELLAEFDWRTIENADQYLDELAIPWQERAAEELQPSGTALLITDLRDQWTPDRFEKLRIALGRLVSADRDGDQFEIDLVVEGRRERIRSAIDRDQAMYCLEGSVDASGFAQIVYKDLQGTEEIWERQCLWPSEADKNCGPFEFRISAWDLDREPLLHYLKTVGSGLGLRDFRRSLRDHSGVSLYRDGFRILPYGEPDNDWMRLDRRRINNPTLRLSNNQILGTIRLGADTNPQLRDQTNREGLVTNPAYEHLREVVCELLGYLENRRFSARRAGGLGWQKGGSKLPDLAQQADAKISQMVDALGRNGGSASTKALREAINERRNSEADTLRLYAGLATNGQLAGMVFEQLKHFMRQLDSELQLVEGDLSFDIDSLDEGFLEDLKWSFGRLRKLSSDMHARMDQVDPLASAKKGRRIRRTTTGHCVTAVLDAFSDLMAEAEVDLRILGSHAIEVETNEDLVQQALAAILANALYWVRLRDKGRWIEVSLQADGIAIGNNGPAIDESDLNFVFEPHFTRREDAAGLGLTLARDLLGSGGMRLSVTSCPSRTTFKIHF